MIKRSKISKRSSSQLSSSRINYRNVSIFSIIGGIVVISLLLLGKLFSNQLNVSDTDFQETETVVERINDLLPSVTPTGTPTPTVTQPIQPTATPTPKIDLGKYTLQVLNGNGLAGSGIEAQNVLELAGFNVESVANASRWDYEKTEIRGKEGIPAEILNTISESMSSLYVTEKIENSANTNSFDILVILGRQKP